MKRFIAGLILAMTALTANAGQIQVSNSYGFYFWINPSDWFKSGNPILDMYVNKAVSGSMHVGRWQSMDRENRAAQVQLTQRLDAILEDDFRLTLPDRISVGPVGPGDISTYTYHVPNGLHTTRLKAYLSDPNVKVWRIWDFEHNTFLYNSTQPFDDFVFSFNKGTMGGDNYDFADAKRQLRVSFCYDLACTVKSLRIIHFRADSNVIKPYFVEDIDTYVQEPYVDGYCTANYVVIGKNGDKLCLSVTTWKANQPARTPEGWAGAKGVLTHIPDPSNQAFYYNSFTRDIFANLPGNQNRPSMKEGYADWCDANNLLCVITVIAGQIAESSSLMCDDEFHVDGDRQDMYRHGIWAATMAFHFDIFGGMTTAEAVAKAREVLNANEYFPGQNAPGETEGCQMYEIPSSEYMDCQNNEIGLDAYEYVLTQNSNPSLLTIIKQVVKDLELTGTVIYDTQNRECLNEAY